MSRKIEETMAFSSQDLKKENISRVLHLCDEALNERGYNSISQIAGYLISNDPAYISNHKSARSIIQSIDRYDIIEELVKVYLERK